MEEFLGVLFCGGRGTRISSITDFISKSFIPVYDKPVFKFGLSTLEDSEHINEIIILTNSDNDIKLSGSGHRTIIQDDEKVTDMFSGWEYIKEVTGTKKNGVLVPSDNISNIKTDKLIEAFTEKNNDILFSVKEISDRKKLMEMGTYSPVTNKFVYKSPFPESNLGVIAPYIIRNGLDCKHGNNIFETVNKSVIVHTGYWFDLGDLESIAEANNWYRNIKLKENEINN
ncbi:MAG TPA: sugar phosphate nucleotidyltransferase [Ignavibacteria bacterium]|nr:sugar phosphate nucleotidyltransferase [Ignavibacteria bacterium]